MRKIKNVKVNKNRYKNLKELKQLQKDLGDLIKTYKYSCMAEYEEISKPK